MKNYLVTATLATIFSVLLAIVIFEDLDKEQARIATECRAELESFKEQRVSVEEQIVKLEKKSKKPPKNLRSSSYCIYDQSIEVQKYFDSVFEIPSFLIGYSNTNAIFKNQLKDTINLSESETYKNSLYYYKRFQTVGGLPIDSRFYGLIQENNRSLITKKCLSPRLAYLDPALRNHILFFAINVERNYQGILAIDSPKGKRYIKHSLQFPSALSPSEYETFTSWVGGDLSQDTKIYENIHLTNEIVNPYRFNTCSKAINLVSNVCIYDHKFDIEMRDIFYDFSKDTIYTNIYCKKSTDNEWVKIASGNLIRMR